MIMNLEYSNFQLPSGTRQGLLTRKSEIPGSILAVDGRKLHLRKCPGVKTSLELHKHLTGLNFGLKYVHFSQIEQVSSNSFPTSCLQMENQ